MKRVLVTGGGGFIGRYACAQLAARGIAVRVLDIYPPSRPATWDEEYLIGDVRDPARVAEVLAGVDGVLHLAAAHHDQGIEHDTYYAVNETGTSVLTAAMQAAGVASLCFYSSAAVYGSEGLGRDERFPTAPDNPYGGSKLKGERVIEGWVAASGARAIVVRPTVVMGRHNFANVYKLISQIARRRYLQVGEGSNVKSLAAVDNLVAATLWLWLDRDDARGIYNYADGPDLTSAKIARVIYRALGRSAPALSVPMPLALLLASPYDLVTKATGRDLGISTARIRKLAQANTQLVPARLVSEGWRPPVTLETALTEMVRWYVDEGAQLPVQRRLPTHGHRARAVMIWVGLAAFGLVLLAWGLYPLLLLAMPERRPREDAAGLRPRLSVVIATREPIDIVRARVDDVWRTAYPHDRLEVVVGVDVNAPVSWTAYRDALGDRAVVVPGDAEGGKPANLNAAARAATGELFVLTDSGQRFEPDTMPALAAALDDPSAGAASGLLQIEDDRRGVIGIFWRFELLLRRLESSRDSLVAVTGACYALRASLWRPLPAGLICDDLLIPLTTRRLGARVVHAPDARATDPRRFTQAQEYRRKVRTLTGMLQVIAWAPWVLVPGRNPLLLQFICHKLLRLATPYLVATGALAFALALPASRWLVVGTVLLAGAAVLAVLLALRPGLRAQAVIAARLFVAPLVATSHALRGDWDVWRPTRA